MFIPIQKNVEAEMLKKMREEQQKRKLKFIG